MVSLPIPNALEAARQAGYRCPKCKKQLIRTGRQNNLAAPSIDHILPQVRGGRLFLRCGTRNWRLLCVGCNSFLATCGHCPGAVAAVEAVAADSLIERQAIARRWRMGTIARHADAAGTRLRAAGPSHRLVLQDDAGPTIAALWPSG